MPIVPVISNLTGACFLFAVCSAGFYFIRDRECVWTDGEITWYGETGLDCENNVLPGPPLTREIYERFNLNILLDNKKPPDDKDWYHKHPFADATVRELPIGIQDMSFYDDTVTGETRQFYPASHDLFLNDPEVLPNLDLDVEKADRSVFLFKCTLFICLPRAHNISLFLLLSNKLFIEDGAATISMATRLIRITCWRVSQLRWPQFGIPKSFSTVRPALLCIFFSAIKLPKMANTYYISHVTKPKLPS